MHSPISSIHIYSTKKHNCPLPPQLRHPRQPLAAAPAFSSPTETDSVPTQAYSGNLRPRPPRYQDPVDPGVGRRIGMCQGLDWSRIWGYRELHLSCALFRRRLVASPRLLRTFDGTHMSVRLLVQNHVPGLPKWRQGSRCLACCQDAGIILLCTWILGPFHPLFLYTIRNVKASLP